MLSYTDAIHRVVNTLASYTPESWDAIEFRKGACTTLAAVWRTTYDKVSADIDAAKSHGGFHTSKFEFTFNDHVRINDGKLHTTGIIASRYHKSGQDNRYKVRVQGGRILDVDEAHLAHEEGWDD